MGAARMPGILTHPAAAAQVSFPPFFFLSPPILHLRHGIAGRGGGCPKGLSCPLPSGPVITAPAFSPTAPITPLAASTGTAIPMRAPCWARGKRGATCLLSTGRREPTMCSAPAAKRSRCRQAISPRWPCWPRLSMAPNPARPSPSPTPMVPRPPPRSA
jgi:hypothetical protein